MLQNFRDNLKGITTWLLVGIIIVPFALFGVDSLFLSGSAVEEVASVDGVGITELRLQQAVSIRKQQLLNQYKNMTPDMLDDELLRGPVLDQLVRQKLMAQTAVDQGMRASGKIISDIILNTEGFQTAGRFDKDAFDFNLRRMGYTAKTYRDLLSDEIITNQFLSGITRTGFVTRAELDQLISIQQQKRSFDYLTLPLQPLLDSISVDEEEILDYYQAHPERFNEPEKVVVEYLELRPELFYDEVVVDDSLVREQYDAEIKALKAVVQRRVAHIQIDADNPGLLEEIKEKLASGMDFAVLAKEYSTDLGSAEQGGDLGVVTPGTFPEKFEQAIETLAKGQVSEPVLTESGYHFIKLLESSEAKVPSFEQEEQRIRESIQHQLALELLPQKVESLKELSYNVDSLQTTAQALGLELEISEPFSSSGGTGKLSRIPEAVRAAFSPEVLESGYSSDVLEISDEFFLVLKLKEHSPAHRQAVEDVRDNIADSVRRQKATTQLVQKAEAIKARVDAGEKLQDVAEAESLEWSTSTDVQRFDSDSNPELINQVFSRPETIELPVSGFVPTSSGDVLVYTLTAITAGDPTSIEPDQKMELANSLSTRQASREMQAYLTILESSADIARRDSKSD